MKIKINKNQRKHKKVNTFLIFTIPENLIKYCDVGPNNESAAIIEYI